QVNSASQPGKRVRFIAKQRIHTADPIGSIAVGYIFWFFQKKIRIDFVSLPARRIQERRHQHPSCISAIPPQFDGPPQDWLSFLCPSLVIKELAQVSHRLELVRMDHQRLPDSLLGLLDLA